MAKNLTCSECGAQETYDADRVERRCGQNGEAGAICRGRMLPPGDVANVVPIDNLARMSSATRAIDGVEEMRRYPGVPTMAIVTFRTEYARSEFAAVVTMFGGRLSA